MYKSSCQLLTLSHGTSRVCYRNSKAGQYLHVLEILTRCALSLNDSTTLMLIFKVFLCNPQCVLTPLIIFPMELELMQAIFQKENETIITECYCIPGENNSNKLFIDFKIDYIKSKHIDP